MNRCSACRAPLEDETEPCTYCGALGPVALEQKRAREAAERADWEQRDLAFIQSEQEEFARTERAMESSAKHALVWALLGPILCCLPVGSIVAVVLAIRSRRLADEYAFLSPGRATAALVLGIAGIVLSVGAWVGVGWMMKLESDRKAELRGVIASKDTLPQLEGETACALAELALMEGGYEGYTFTDTLSCSGKVEQREDRAVLRGASFNSANGAVPVFACLERGTRWSVTALRSDDRCEVAGETATGE